MDDIRNLEKKVKERQKLGEWIINFVDKVAHKYGKMTKCSEGSSHTNIIYELDVAEFHLKANTGHCMMGGNNFEVTYQGKKVCDVYYQADVEECEFRTFVDGPWILALRKLAKNWKRVLDAKKKKDEKQKLKDEAAAAQRNRDEERRRKLEEDAKRLGI